MSDEQDSSTNFLRQRRDLFVISAILLLIPVAEIQTADHITIPFIGVSLSVGKPEVITLSLWILWIYWYLRYFQAYLSLNKNYFYEKYISAISGYLYPIFAELAEQSKAKVIRNNEHFSKKGASCNYSFIKQEYFLLKSVYTCEYSGYDPSTSADEKVQKVIAFSGLKYIFIKIKALLKCCFANIEATEYMFPFVFGISPLVYFLVNLKL
jgi:hypothetical protein